jgi:hypothetical protein
VLLIERITALLDSHGVETTNKAEGSLGRPLTLAERVRSIIAERDRARSAELLIRESHKATVARCGVLADMLERATGVRG